MFNILIYFVIYLCVTSSIVLTGLYLYSAIDGTRDMKFESVNSAIAISMAGFFGGVSLILMNAFAGSTDTSVSSDFINTIGYAVIGMVILITSKKILDKIVFSDVDFKEKLINNNKLVAIRESAGSLATGIAVFGSLYWVDFNASGGVINGAFIITLVLMSLLAHSYYLRSRHVADYTVEKGSPDYDKNASIVIDNCSSVISMSFSLGSGFAISHALGLSVILSIASAPVIGFLFMFVVSFVSSLIEKKIFTGETTGCAASRAVIRMAFFVPSLMFFM